MYSTPVGYQRHSAPAPSRCADSTPRARTLSPEFLQKSFQVTEETGVTIRWRGAQKRRETMKSAPKARGSGAIFRAGALASLALARRYGPMLAGVQLAPPSVYGVGGLGGVAQGTLVKSKKSSRFGCAASRAVRCAELPMNRFSTNLITAV